MKKISLIICSLFFYHTAKSQGNFRNEVTNIVPPSPQSAEITTYGNQPLNEYKGMAQVNIPITGIKEKDLFNNIELKYSKLGVRVNDVPNNVGISWLLDMGGVITRTIYDLPDEMQLSTKRLIFDNLSAVHDLTQSPDGSANAALLNTYVKDPTLDNEVDVFNISVNGLSGSFYLDKNLNPVLLTDTHQFKIETVGDFKTTHEFILTTNEGIKYYFGGNTAIEKTFIRASLFGGFTSFYLTKIQNMQGNVITFEYKDIGAKIIPMSETERQVIRNQVYQDCANPVRSLGLSNFQSGYVLTINNSKVLTVITGEEKTIKFNYDTTDVDQLSSIEVFNKNKKHQEFDFIYLNPTPLNKRSFLSNIKIYDFSNGVKTFNNEYAFEYTGSLTSIPKRMSRSTDLFGYYNGRTSSTLLPNLNLLIGDGTQVNFPDLVGLADRRSSFNDAIIGTLSSITYPTKGKTTFEYEGLGQKTLVYDSKYGELDADTATNEATSIINGSEIMDDKASITLYISQHIANGPPSNITANFKILDATTNAVLSDQNLILPKPIFGQDGPSEKTVTFDFTTVKTKQYKFVMKLLRTNYHDIGHYEIVFKSKYVEVNNVGLRLKKIYDFDGVNTTNIKRLYYTSFDYIKRPDLLPDNLYPIGGFTTYQYDMAGCRDANGNYLFTPKAIQQTILSSQSSSSYFDLNPSFPVVTISYGGDNFEKGGEEKRFMDGVLDETTGFYSPPQPSGTDYYGDSADLNLIASSAGQDFNRSIVYEDYNGRLIENRVFSSLINGKAYMKQKTAFNYDFIESKSIYNLMGKSVYERYSYSSGLDPNNIVTNLALFFLQRKSYSTPLNNKTETQYFEDVPVDVDNDSSYKKLTTTTNYFYNNPLHYQVTQQKITHPDNTVFTTNYEYAHEKSNQKLINANMIGIPLETKAVEKQNDADPGKMISRSEVKYDDPANLLPSSVISYDVLNSTPSTELIYNKYDAKGNIQQYTTKEGIPTTIIWGYNGMQPLAKIEGAKLTDITPSLIDTIVNASNTDAAAGFDNDETQFLTILDTFRKNSNLSNYQVTTYTYDPLVGVRSITSPSGIREIYLYDATKRLKEIRQQEKDSAGNIVYKTVKEFKYNYKN